uniref:Respiratory burst oxidase n=1 Tax=Rhizophora mucronata TaxID=61149 RepID=A0A2P2JGD0_RHIMU
MVDRVTWHVKHLSSSPTMHVMSGIDLGLNVIFFTFRFCFLVGKLNHGKLKLAHLVVSSLSGSLNWKHSPHRSK